MPVWRVYNWSEGDSAKAIAIVQQVVTRVRLWCDTRDVQEVTDLKILRELAGFGTNCAGVRVAL